MRHLNSFNESSGGKYIDRIKKLIDMDLINYVVDRLIKYEDMGHNLSINFYYHDYLKGTMPHLLSSHVYHTNQKSNKTLYIRGLDLDKIGDIVRRGEVSIRIVLEDEEGDYVDLRDHKDDMIKLLSNRFEFSHDAGEFIDNTYTLYGLFFKKIKGT